VLPWLIVTGGWSAVTVAAGHALAGAGSRLLLPVLGVSAAAILVGSLVRLRLRNRKAAPPPSTPSTS
jgi:hypothetical protein